MLVTAVRRKNALFAFLCRKQRWLSLPASPTRPPRPGNHSDLLWASCGGGGGTFGIVTEFEFKLNVLPDGGGITEVKLPFATGAATITAAFERCGARGVWRRWWRAAGWLGACR